jgi:hypothetical protein
MNAKTLTPWVLFLYTCSSNDLSITHASVSDSAGIVIVVTDSSAVAAAPIGLVKRASALDPRGPPESVEFYQVEGLTVLSGGRFGIINRSTGSLRVFDHRGDYERSLGSAGEGPGEFRHLWFAVSYRGDSIVTHDGRMRRLTVFDAMGQVGRTFLFASHEQYSPFVTPVAALKTGNFVVYSRAQMMGLLAYGVTVDSSVFGLHAPNGDVLSLLGRWPTGARMRYLREGLITTLSAPFAPEVDGTAWQEGFCLDLARCLRSVATTTWGSCVG